MTEPCFIGNAGLVDAQRAQGEVHTGVTGGNLSATVVPKSLGTTFKVRDAVTGAGIDLSHYDSW